MEPSFAQRILNANKPFFLFHTHAPTRAAVQEAVERGKSMDLDIAIDESGEPYLGHSKEYYQKSGKTQLETMPFWEAIELVSSANIPVILDCKGHDAWPVVEEVIGKIGAHRCLVHSFASEFKFDYEHNDLDYPSEWSPIKTLNSIKGKFPSATTTASCKFLPRDLLTVTRYEPLLEHIRTVLKDNRVDTVCLNVPDESMSDKALEFFLAEGILAHVGVDKIDVSSLSGLYVGETDNLAAASDARLLGY